jgi:hypothetical protein
LTKRAVAAAAKRPKRAKDDPAMSQAVVPTARPKITRPGVKMTASATAVTIAAAMARAVKVIAKPFASLAFVTSEISGILILVYLYFYIFIIRDKFKENIKTYFL